jgi:precorrin-6B methylase 2
MKNIIIATLILASLAIVLIGCGTVSNTVLLPENKGTYKVIAFGSSEAEANKAAVAKATKVCNDCNKTMIVQKHASKYQGGLSKGNKELIKAGSEIASLIEDKNLSIDPSSSNDYKVIIQFKCQ